MAKRCLGCMKMKTQSPVCEHCGYNENIPNFPHQLPIGTVLRDQYVVGKVLGQGGFGITYMGWDQNLDVPIAIKEYFPNGFVNRECTHSLSVTCGDSNRPLFYHNRERFIREAKALAKLREVSGIVRIHNFFQENDTAYIVMEYVEGIDLKRYIRMRNRTMGAGEILTVLKPMMEALGKVHEAGLVHRDITPDNIMILPDGSAKLLDFGAVREVLDPDADKNLSQATEAILKQGFAPMEQYQNRGSLGPWTDVYALCATIYYCVTGRVPPDAPARLLEGKPLDWNSVPGLSQQQISALERGMAIMPKQRTASIGQLYNELYHSPQPQPAPQNIPNSAVQSHIQSSVDFRNAYQNSGYQNPVPNPAPDPIPNTGRQNFSAAGYPNHTVPLEANPINGYQSSLNQNHQAAPQPVKQKKSKKGLFIGIAAAAVVAIAAIGAFGREEPAAKPSTPVIQAPVQSISEPTSVDSLLAEGADHTYTYRNGSRLELYYDDKDQERCRIYYNDSGVMEYKFLAQYHSSGELENQWVYDGEGNLIRQETYTRNSDGDAQSYVLLDGSANVLETRSYQYDSRNNLTCLAYMTGDGTITQENTYTYDSQGNRLTGFLSYRNGETTELTYNENGDTKTQRNYDANGNLEYGWDYEYDADGTQTGSVQYAADGTVEYNCKNEYDANDNLIRMVNYNPNGTVSYTMEYSYIGKGVQISYIYQSGNYKSEYEYVDDISNVSVLQFSRTTSEYSNYDTTTYYDSFGNQLSSISYNFDGSLYSTSVYSYDNYGTSLGHTYTSYSEDGSSYVYEYNADYETTGSWRYDENGNLKSWTEYEFDANGNRIKELTYNADGSLASDAVNTYDDSGTMTQRVYTSYSEDGSRYVSINDGDYNTLESMNYDANGNLTYYRYYKYVFNSFGKPDIQYCYDENGNLQSWTEYTYDENGNYVDSEYHYN